jgi:ComF family protein
MNYLRASRTPGTANGRSRRLFARLGGALAAMLPQACEVCADWAGRRAVCRACESALPRLPERHCPRCCDRSESGDACARCLAHPPAFDRTIAAFAYASPVDDLVQSLKYAHRLHLAEWLGQALAETWAAREVPIPAGERPILIPMPLHPDRLVERGFNQATEIARPLARLLNAPIAHEACVRVRATAPQARMAISSRPANVIDAFECREDLDGRTAIIVDDVMTSGASIGELARVVRLHGASRVIVAIAARTLHD